MVSNVGLAFVFTALQYTAVVLRMFDSSILLTSAFKLEHSQEDKKWKSTFLQ